MHSNTEVLSHNYKERNYTDIIYRQLYCFIAKTLQFWSKLNLR